MLHKQIRRIAGLPEEKTKSEVLQGAVEDLLKVLKPPAKPEEFDLLDGGCSCHTGNPPCSYCVDTTECSVCNTRVYADDCTEREGEMICNDCYQSMLSAEEDYL